MVLAILLSASAAWAQIDDEQGTAYQALRTVGRQLGRGSYGRIVSLNGVEGDPQPPRWTILLVDRRAPGGMREVQVENGRIISNQPGQQMVGTTKGAVISTARLNLDSSGAFSVASYTADKSHVNFDRVSYTLRTNDRGVPVWIVTLQDQSRQPLGTIHINANRGNVVRVEGMYRGANMAQVEEDRGPERSVRGGRRENLPNEQSIEPGSYEEGSASDEDDPDENAVKRSLKRMFRRTKDDAANMFHRVRRSFADFVAGDS